MSRIKYMPPTGTPIFSEAFQISAAYMQGNNTYTLPGTQLINNIGTVAMFPISTIFFNNTDGTISDLQFGATTNKLSDIFTVDGGRVFNAVYYNINGSTAPYDVWFNLNEAYSVSWSAFTGATGSLTGIFYYGKSPLSYFTVWAASNIPPLLIWV